MWLRRIWSAKLVWVARVGRTEAAQCQVNHHAGVKSAGVSMGLRGGDPNAKAWSTKMACGSHVARL